MRAALAVTGKAGRRVTEISIGLCLAGTGVGCMDDSKTDPGEFGDFPAVDGTIRIDAVSGPDMRPNGMPRPDVSVATMDLSVLPESDVSAPDAAVVVTPPDAGHIEPPDMSVEEPDATMVADAAAEDTCLSDEERFADWRCCQGHNWDRSIPGCTPCDIQQDREQWVHCVTCDPLGQGVLGGDDPEYQACCGAVGFDFQMGCIAWGPPAPPAWDGRTLAELLGESEGVA